MSGVRISQPFAASARSLGSSKQHLVRRAGPRYGCVLFIYFEFLMLTVELAIVLLGATGFKQNHLRVALMVSVNRDGGT
mgnify:CR=1 FL=1